MPEARVHFNNTTIPNWNKMYKDSTSIADLIDTGGNLTGWAVTQLNNQLIAGQTSWGYDEILPTGNAAWVDHVDVLQTIQWTNSSTSWVGIRFENLDNSKTYTVEFHATTGSERYTETRVNGSASQILATDGNKTEINQFLDISPTNGQILFEWRSDPVTNTGTAYNGAVRIIEVDSTTPGISLSSDPQLGATLSGAYVNFGGTPTGPIQLDQGARSLPDEAITVDSGAGTWVTDTALPGLPANGESVTPFPVIGADIDITLPDPGA